MDVPLVGPWQQATIHDVRDETPNAKTFRLRLAQPVPFLAGQYFVVRLTAPDGYRAQRSYSLSSPPDEGPSEEVELTVELLPDGEVSSFLHEVVMAGDELEVRGPIGGNFVWPGDHPALLIGGGSGVVPLMSMYRLARRLGNEDLLRLVVSVRRPEDLYYAGELDGPQVTVLYTREAPPGDPRGAGRITLADLEPVVMPGCVAFVCGTPGFADTVSDMLMELGVPASNIRVERFGPSS